ncbi:chemotaxis protein CheA [Reyranella sp.]|uniref:chemotaxis protein CheA n=1 Tax=Reyranella sp. TaxID=1929291 RepID=UPI003D099826
MNEFVEQFVIEGRELVAQGNDDLLALEERPDDKERLDSAFRAFHTLKGAAGIVDFVAMGRALHAAEDALSAVRSGVAPVTAPLIDLCLGCLDQVGTWIDRMQASGEIPEGAEGAADDLVRRFTALGASGAKPIRPDARPAGGAAALSSISRELLEAQKLLLAEPSAEGAAGRLGSAGRVAANVLRHQGLDTTDLESLLQTSLLAGDAPSMAAAIDRILSGLAEQEPEAPGTLPAQASDTTLRIDVERIERLVRLTGELLIAKNAIGHSAQLAQEGGDARQLAVALKNQHLMLGRLVAELQQSVFSLRVLPLQRAFQRFPRLVREMAASVGKPVHLLIEGAATEADKSIVEAIVEPLIHVLRNALDHGIEGPDERRAAGKPPTATVRLRAARQGDRIVVDVEDDGRGIDVARVREVAQARNVAPAARLDALSDDEVVELIFAPGFSTASQVTDLSGRGVGMDAVRTAIERLGGRVSVSSRPALGTVVRLSLPFTVMMTQVLTVEAAGQVFGVPMEAVVETVRVARAAIASIGAAQALVLRNRTVPVIDLGHALGHEARASGAEANVLIVSVAGQLGGLEVDRLGDRLDIMLKAPVGLLAGIPGIDGTTLLGDGRVLIVLDLSEIFRYAGS